MKFKNFLLIILSVFIAAVETSAQDCEIFLDMAEAGQPDAQAMTGACYYGRGDYGEAAYWCRRAAEQGSAFAQATLGSIYESGYCLNPDREKARNYYQAAADQGDKSAAAALERLLHVTPEAEEETPPTPTVEPQENAVAVISEPEQLLPLIEPEDYISFGTYEQDNDRSNGSEPIEWIVLETDGNEKLLISRYGLDAQPYNEGFQDGRWKGSTLQQWLNDDFLYTAFSPDEQKRILTNMTFMDTSHEVSISDVLSQDKIFLLDEKEAEKYFADDGSRLSMPTDYAKMRGADSNFTLGDLTNGGGRWWLRSSEDYLVNYVSSLGDLNTVGSYLAPDKLMVRPAIRVSMEDEAQNQEPDDPQHQELLADFSRELREKYEADPSYDQVGSIVKFGSYEQDNDTSNGAEPVEWIVLDTDGSKSLLLSRYALDNLPYNDNAGSVTWETCSLRQWLNDHFFNEAFSPAEQSAISETTVSNLEYRLSNREGVYQTKDRLFLLNYREAGKYLTTKASIDLKCEVTKFASPRQNGGTENWWLRAPLTSNEIAMLATGYLAEGINRIGRQVDNKSFVRPAFWISISNGIPAPVSAGEAPSVIKGSIVTLGTYEQDADVLDGQEPIEWIVLDIEGDQVFLLSRFGLDTLPYEPAEELSDEQYFESILDSLWYGSDAPDGITWADSKIRKWLNEDFFNSAFSPEERQAVHMRNVTNDINDHYLTDAGPDTADKVFLLSYDEVKTYLDLKYYRYATATDYAHLRGAIGGDPAGSGNSFDGRTISVWWLRTPGSDTDMACVVDTYGDLSDDGRMVKSDEIMVRPAIWADLSAVTPLTSQTALNPAVHINDVPHSGEIGSVITFGTYEQDNEIANGDEPIEWIVLDKKGSAAMLTTRYGVESREYHTKNEDSTWENCWLRHWLNKDFFRDAFTADEQNKIVSMMIPNPDNPVFGTDGGADTMDKVYLLSLDDVIQYFPTDLSRLLPASDVEIRNDSWNGILRQTYVNGRNTNSWWLRTPGEDAGKVMYVDRNGSIETEGTYNYSISGNSLLVRPVIWVDLSL